MVGVCGRLSSQWPAFLNIAESVLHNKLDGFVTEQQFHGCDLFGPVLQRVSWVDAFTVGGADFELPVSAATPESFGGLDDCSNHRGFLSGRGGFERDRGGRSGRAVMV